MKNFIILGGCAQNLWLFLDGALHEEKNSSGQNKNLKTEYATKSRDFLRCDSNLDTKPILSEKLCWESLISKFLKFGPPLRKNFTKNLPICQKFTNRDLFVIAFKIYICVTFW